MFNWMLVIFIYRIRKVLDNLFLLSSLDVYRIPIRFDVCDNCRRRIRKTHEFIFIIRQRLMYLFSLAFYLFLHRAVSVMMLQEMHTLSCSHNYSILYDYG